MQLGARANLSMLPSCVHATLCDSNVSYRFFIGTAGLDADTAAFLQAEANNFGDLALMPRLSETYAGLTTKLLDSLAFADEHFGRFDYLLKVSAFAPRSGQFSIAEACCRQLPFLSCRCFRHLSDCGSRRTLPGT